MQGRARGLALCCRKGRANRHPSRRSRAALVVAPAVVVAVLALAVPPPVVASVSTAVVPRLGLTGGDLSQGQRTNARGVQPGRSPHRKAPAGQRSRRIDDLIVFFAHPLGSPSYSVDRDRRPPTTRHSGSRRSFDLLSVWAAGGDEVTAEGREFRSGFSLHRRATNVRWVLEAVPTGTNDDTARRGPGR